MLLIVPRSDLQKGKGILAGYVQFKVNEFPSGVNVTENEGDMPYNSYR
jgi:hypothetical protein